MNTMSKFVPKISRLICVNKMLILVTLTCLTTCVQSAQISQIRPVTGLGAAAPTRNLKNSLTF